MAARKADLQTGFDFSAPAKDGDGSDDPVVKEGWFRQSPSLFYRTRTTFGRVWPGKTTSFWAQCRPEPFKGRETKWSKTMEFSTEAKAKMWVEGWKPEE